ncbi:MAG: hypothetical protein LAN62_14560 [Acidobacteriia bacterium]|nr:hypothetical protein [Terriglobia bacterium]
MRMLKSWGAVLALIALIVPHPAVTAPPRRQDSEQDLLARMQRESDPIKKAKLEVRLARVKLLASMAALDQGNMEETNRLLSAYLETLNGVWGRLKSSGRVASKSSSGFKELDIELREDARYLEDLKHRIPYTDRGTAEKVAGRVDELRSEVLTALFPRRPLRKGGKANKP